MNRKHRIEGTGGNGSRGGSPPDPRHQDDVLSGTTERAFENAKIILERYEELISTAHRETALQLWRGITPPLDDHLRSSLEMTKRVFIASLSQGITLAEIATKLQLEGFALLRRMTAESFALTHLPPSEARTKRGAL